MKKRYLTILAERGMDFFSVFEQRNFRQVWSGQFVSLAGGAAHAVAISFYLKELTDSGAVVGLIMFFAGFSALCCLPLAGVFADRYNRLRIVMICDGLCAASTLVMAIMFLLCSSTGVMTYIIAIFTIAIRVATSFFRPAFAAMFPDLVSRAQLAPANALYKSGARVGDLCGTTCGGVLYKIFGPGSLCLLNTLTYIASIFFLSRVKPKRLFSPRIVEGFLPKVRAPLRSELLHGVRSITSMPGGLQFLSLALVINFLATPIFVLMPFHASGYLHGGAALYGTLMATLSAGVLVGYMLAAKWSLVNQENSCYIVVTAIVLMCASFVVFACSEVLSIAYGALLVAGVANGYWSILFETALQGAVPRDKLGRVYACFALLSGGLMPLSSLMSGLLLDLIGKNTSLLFTVCAVGMTIYALVMSLDKKFLEFFSSFGSRKISDE